MKEPNGCSRPRMAEDHGRGATCDVVLFEGVAVDLVLIGTVLLQPFAHILLGPQGHWFGQLHISWLGRKTQLMITLLRSPVH